MQSIDHNGDVVTTLLETFANLRDFISKAEQTAQTLNSQTLNQRTALQKILNENVAGRSNPEALIDQLLEESDAE